MNVREQRDRAGQREAGEGDEVEAGQGGGEARGIAHEATAAGLPGTRAFHHPAPRQEDAATRARRRRAPARRLPGAAAARAGGSPVAPSSPSARATVSPVASCTARAHRSTCARSRSWAGVTCQASRWPRVSTAACTCDPFVRLAPSEPARAPLAGVDCRVWLSQIAARGWARRPAARRRMTRRSWTIASKQPAASHRRAW